ncbi:Uu.00g057090.m01.CDS01 [Anthostomella pinea]|uniref:Alpha-L-arabinofuranosidase n=1 Tax=Anthostomella pinea TaxID=933095 RepID=A0AAI8VSE9_9PEZI|nr:Uu.00g057090.m01.CDS01 [Anthostomella pinea]
MFPRPELAFGLTAAATLAAAATGPCDIYASGGTPCVAAHSTTRALYGSYTGALYQVKRGSDNATTNISPLSSGVANAATQDNFCAGSTCLISIIYDQSGRGNHLSQAPGGSAAQGPNVDGTDYLAGATGATGYRNNQAQGTATGDSAEGLYAVFDGTHYNAACCFDYGNAEINSKDTGDGHMESIYFGSGKNYGYGAGSGPWILADLENGLYTENGLGQYSNNPTQNSRFVTAVVKGDNGNQWAVRGGNSVSGGLTTYFSGPRPPPDYNPMSKEGAIILGIGGDNSNGAQGTFYEGVMTTGYPSDATENSVQANIVAATYGTTGLTSGPAINVGSHVSLRATTSCCTDRYIAHSGAEVNTQVVSSSSTTTLKQQASWIVHTGLGNSACLSFESADTPGSFIRHSNYALVVNANDGGVVFAQDATFCPEESLNDAGSNILRSWSYPARYWRHYSAELFIAGNGGPHFFDTPSSFNDDTSFAVGTAFA